MPLASALRNLVQGRAGNRCEYCRLHQDDDAFFRFHVEHIVARQHGGASVEQNLALACHHCNLHKGPNLTGIDPHTSALVPLIDPRKQSWDEHFSFNDNLIEGLTATGRATVHVLASNARDRIGLRMRAKHGI